MVRAKCKLGWRWLAPLLLLVLAVVMTPQSSRADAPRAMPAANPARHPIRRDEVMVLTPPAVPATSPSSPAIEPAPDLTRVAGSPLVAVDVVLDDEVWPDVSAPPISVMRPGDRVSASLVRRTIDEALASGHFADAHVVFLEDDRGVRGVVHVMPRKVVEAIRVDAHGAPINTDSLVRDAGITVQGELVARDLPGHRQRIEAMLRRFGFPSPRVIITTLPTGYPLRVVVRVDINTGAPRKIERRVFYPFRVTPEHSSVRRAPDSDIEQAYLVHSGDRADETALQAADTALQNRIRARGFHRAEVSHDVVLSHGLVVLRVRVDFGALFETRYEGNDAFDNDAIDADLDLEDETDRTPSHLVQKVHDFYVKRGFLDAEVTIETRGKPNEAVHYIVFHVVEHARVQVVARAYPCLRESDIEKLPGGPTSAKGIGREIDSFLEEELPGGDWFMPPRPSGLDATIAGPLGQRGTRLAPLELDPHGVYAPETYERAVQHVQELYRSEGFLSAQIGPVQIVRRRCNPRSPSWQCVPTPIEKAMADVCTYDASGLPLPVPPLESDASCIPDPVRGVACESRIGLRIPVKLGPRTQLYDLSFSGVRAIAPAVLAKATALNLGTYVNTVQIEEARRRLVDAYKEEGYTFADVKYELEPSVDRTRARVHFFVSEGEQVIVQQINLQGNVRTKTQAILRRVALEVGKPYRASEVRKTEEYIATLGVFSSVSVSLDNPFVPERNKVVVVTVVERPRQYTEIAPGFSTGEGFRLTTEYGHRNLWGNAISFTARLQLAYIPTPLIIDPTARDNYRNLNLFARLGMRATGGIVIPNVGLGPRVRTGLDALVVHDLQRDFYITKLAAVPNINYRPLSEFQVTFFHSFEFNNSRIFQTGSIADYITSLALQGINTTDIVRQLLVPDGESYVLAQRVLASWDRRDNAFNASRGTYIVTGIEHVDGFPVKGEQQTPTTPPLQSHFFKLTQTFAGYIPLPRGFRIASMTRVGGNIQLAKDSSTYPDRLFFLGGVDSMRGWMLNSFIPQDDVDRIRADAGKPDTVPDPQHPGQQIPNPAKFTQNTRPIRGGNFMVNERIELRIPIHGPFETVIFSDLGNLWIDPTYPFHTGKFPIRADVGTGIRLQTPVGPLAVDYGFNITREPYEDIGAINFAIGLY
ncbi:MAG: BamA/TamA family outer membrane protein [Polyangiaceae bacterium]|nr:BamA/TamA family outer membrane protein [Polyangiaceae bacterium]